MLKDSPPKRPLSPFFLYKEKLKASGEGLSSQEITEKFKSLSRQERQIYVEDFKSQKEIYDKYLFEQKGIKPRSICEVKEPEYKAHKVRDICSNRDECRPLEFGVPVALAAVTVNFSTYF